MQITDFQRKPRFRWKWKLVVSRLFKCCLYPLSPSTLTLSISVSIKSWRLKSVNSWLYRESILHHIQKAWSLSQVIDENHSEYLRCFKTRSIKMEERRRRTLTVLVTNVIELVKRVESMINNFLYMRRIIRRRARGQVLLVVLLCTQCEVEYG